LQKVYNGLLLTRPLKTTLSNATAKNLLKLKNLPTKTTIKSYNIEPTLQNANARE
jgi:hypothetical protein